MVRTCKLSIIAALYFFLCPQLADSQYAGARDRFRGNVHRAPVILRGDQPPPSDTDRDSVETREEIHPLTDLTTQWQIRPRGYTPIKLHPCEQSSCYPATGNLLIGREHQLYSSSTCGLYGQQRYCIVSHLEDRKKCFWCNSEVTPVPKPHLNHSISNIVYRLYPGTRQKSWWQSENGKEFVTIQLNLEAEFHFTHLIITFKTFRPAAMLIERSYDYGETWQVYRYFAHKCSESFPGVPERYPMNLTDVICESRYSGVAPSTDGELIYRVLPPTLPIDNPYSQEVQTLLKMTNLRINFTKLHTLGDDLLDKREEIQEKYYYAITDMVVRGSCSCYGHANRCLPLPGIDPKPDMVHGRCECTHNTKGSNCDECEDFFNDLPWRPAIGKQTNACKRCNCNNHATSCHFSRKVYEATGRISGGVCDGCKHNTMGPNCEQCKPYFYRDPTRDIQDPEVCRPCDCDPHGSIDGGICDSITDAENGYEAGKCHCKTNVEGRRCDTCKNGFWNFDANNTEGCQECTCNILGTIDNQGCNVYTGECTCKRYVTGRDCNQCLPEFWGLSDKKDGCQLCDCDPGGSYDNQCDVISGQCKCRDSMGGRRCDSPKQQHFTASVDFLLYEAELARGSPTCQVVIREPYRDGRDDTWTGTGFMKAYEESHIEFNIDDIKTSMDYDIVLRYEPQLSENWQEVVITVIRPGPVDPNGQCANASPQDDVKVTTLQAFSRSVAAFPPACLEAGQTYRIRLDFKRYNFDKPTPSASVLIDSIVLVPRIEKLPIFSGTAPAEQRRQEFERHRCELLSHSVQSGEMPDVCKTFFNSIGAYVFNGAISCQCDQTGSVSKLCDDYGGHCLCKPNVVGRRCDRCAPGTFGFGPEGCKACDCNSIGALDNFCNTTTGQCKCRPNTYGRECDQCRNGFWNFPNCQRCDCNGHADICDSRTGACSNCRDYTQGHTCDHCTEGYYGDPRLDIDIPCRACPCPGTAESLHSYADRCSLDPYTKDVICECKEGYSGSRCDVCADNYYGNPEEPGGVCQSCECSDKVDLLKPGNCDPHTGQCKQCLYDTTGDHCERCRAGFFRLDDDQLCEECVCHLLGTNSSAGPCDHTTGQCPCLPNTIGKQCDQCEVNHWKIASGQGCEPCSCDAFGSLQAQCNEFDGQCICKENFGGRQCNECRANYWGDPKSNECTKCSCDLYGSETLQCDRKTGQCLCRPGIGGYNCDVCDRGYLGSAPVCSPCGECFDNWDRILKEYKNTTLILIDQAKTIHKIGTKGAYTKEFDAMQSQLDEVEQLLLNTAEINLDSIYQNLEKLRQKINDTEAGSLKELDLLLANIIQDSKLSKIQLDELKNKKNKLEKATQELENNGTALQEANVQGALNLIRQAKVKAEQAAEKVNQIQKTIEYAERQCKATENLVNLSEKEFKKMQENNEMALNQLKQNLTNLNEAIPELNSLVCDGHGNPCDPICGGAGCGQCGNVVSCENGAKQLAETALSLANNTETALSDKESKANDFIRNVSQLNTAMARNLAQEAYDKALETFRKSDNCSNQIDNIKNRIQEFLSNQNETTPKEIQMLGEEILKINIDLKPSEITELATKIKETVKSLTDIQPIIEETRDSLERVQKLKNDADNAKSKAQGILDIAGEVTDALKNSSLAQNNAAEAIKKAHGDMDEVEELVKEIEKITNETEIQTKSTEEEIGKLTALLEELERNITNIEFFAQIIINKSREINKEAESTYKTSEDLLTKYGQVKKNLTNKLDSVNNSKVRASNLFDRALNLTAIVSKAENEIKTVENDNPSGQLLALDKEIQDLIAEMEKHTSKIESRELQYKTCT